MKSRKIKIHCVNCREHIYNYNGRKMGTMHSESVESIKPEWPKPAPFSEMKCPNCGEQIFMLRSTGERAKQWKLQYNR